jgi:hypothetical protein
VSEARSSTATNGSGAGAGSLRQRGGAGSDQSGGPVPSIVEFLEGRRERACFVAELRRTAASRAGEGEFEAALQHLVADGTLVMQRNFCSDPHFAGEDLRVVALVDTDGREGAAAAALQSCERVWARWMAGFLASHRCA